MEENQFEAMILAFAGVHRMELDEYIVEELPLNIFTSPVGQGCVAVEAAKNLNPRERELIKAALNHTETEIALLCERAYLKKLEGGCSIPSFGIAKVENNILTMSAGIISLDGKDMVRKSISGSIQNPEALGLELAEQVLSDGGEEILREIKKVRK
jgi:hydroxymethylbilane synthase